MNDFVYLSSPEADAFPYVLEYRVTRDDGYSSLQIVRVKNTGAGKRLVERWNKNVSGWHYNIESLKFSPHVDALTPDVQLRMLKELVQEELDHQGQSTLESWKTKARKALGIEE